MTLIEQINEAIKNAIRAKDSLRLDVMRMLKSKILAVDARANLPDEEILKLFKTYHGNIKEAFEQAKSVGRMDVAERLEAELAIIQEYLPKTLSLEKTRELVLEAIQESGAKSKKELGLVMKILKKHGSAIDGKLAKELTDELLGG